jgi:hypothetical protein
MGYGRPAESLPTIGAIMGFSPAHHVARAVVLEAVAGRVFIVTRAKPLELRSWNWPSR